MARRAVGAAAGSQEVRVAADLTDRRLRPRRHADGGQQSCRLQLGTEERCEVLHRLVDTLAVVEADVGGPVDDDALPRSRSRGAQVLAVPERAGLATGDDEHGLRQEPVHQVEPDEFPASTLTTDPLWL